VDEESNEEDDIEIKTKKGYAGFTSQNLNEKSLNEFKGMLEKLTTKR
jgi:hypothetical protein